MDDATKFKMDLFTKTYAELEAAAKEAAHHVELVKSQMLELMEAEQIKTHEVTDGGKVYRATYVQATVPLLDEKGLREEFGDDVIDDYCRLVLDKKAVEIAMEDGDLDPLRVGKHVTERKNKPSVRFTARAADDS